MSAKAILLLATALIVSALVWMAVARSRVPSSETVPVGVQRIAAIRDTAIRECSGLAASRRFPDVFWTHNDSNNPQILFATSRTGVLLGKWDIIGAKLTDWEDVATDESGHLYLADTGDNQLHRTRVAVHRIREPDPSARERSAAIEYSWTLVFPSGPRNCESLIVLGQSAYLISKRKQLPAELFRFALTPNTNVTTMEFVAELPITTTVTGGALSPGGRMLALISRQGAYLYKIDGEISRVRERAPEFASFKNRKLEGCTFVPEGLLGISETREIFLFTNAMFRSE